MSSHLSASHALSRPGAQTTPAQRLPMSFAFMRNIVIPALSTCQRVPSYNETKIHTPERSVQCLQPPKPSNNTPDFRLQAVWVSSGCGSIFWCGTFRGDADVWNESVTQGRLFRTSGRTCVESSSTGSFSVRWIDGWMNGWMGRWMDETTTGAPPSLPPSRHWDTDAL